MQPAAVNFHSYAKRYGGSLKTRQDRAILDSYLHEVENAVNHVNAVCRASKLRNGRGEDFISVCGVTREMDANASAEFVDGQHFIAVTLGQVRSAMYLSNEISLKTRCVLDLGTVPQNDHEPFELFHEASFWDRNRDFIARQGSVLSQADTKRKHLCYYLRWSMLMFAFYHELAHGHFGHCRVLEALDGSSRLREVGASGIHSSHSRIHHVMEYAADRAATKLIMSTISKDSDWANIFLDSRFEVVNRVRFSLLASALLTMSWYVSERRSGSTDGKHPKPNLRFVNVCSAIEEHFKSQGATDIYRQALGKASYDLAYITHRSADLAEAVKTFSLDSKAAKRGVDYWSQELGFDSAEEQRIESEMYLSYQ